MGFLLGLFLGIVFLVCTHPIYILQPHCGGAGSLARRNRFPAILELPIKEENLLISEKSVVPISWTKSNLCLLEKRPETYKAIYGTGKRIPECGENEFCGIVWEQRPCAAPFGHA